jgi:predicted MPP superfamily phosphohydrolase
MMFIFCAASLFVLAQYYVFTSLRAHLWRRRSPVDRKTAYGVLGLTGLFNFVFVQMCFGHWGVAVGSEAHKIIAVIFFSYFGFVMVLASFFLLLAPMSHALRLKDLLKAREKSPFPLSASVSDNAEKTQDQVCESLRPDGRLSALESRREFLRYGAAAGLSGALVLTGCGAAGAYGRPTCEAHELPGSSLDESGVTFTIAHASDFHFGFFWGEEELSSFVNALNAVEGDFLAITGDVFHSSLSPIEEAIPILRRLRPRALGSFVVLGNHEFYAGVNRSVRALEEAGLRVLRDEWVVLEKEHASIRLGGIDDPLENWLWGTSVPGFAQFASRAPSSPGPSVLLSHRPAVLPAAALAGIDLVLAGHTHGGQIVLPVPGAARGLSLARIVSPYTYGWYKEADCRMYVNRGAGLTFIPWRVNCPPEVALIRLRAPKTRVG